MVRRVEAGQNWTAVEPPDVILLHLQGEVTPAEAEVINRANREYARDLSHFFYLIDMGGGASLGSEVRQSVAAALEGLPLRGTAIYNADLRTKVVAKLLLIYVNRNRSNSPISFHSSEDEARSWIEERRKEITDDRQDS